VFLACLAIAVGRPHASAQSTSLPVQDRLTLEDAMARALGASPRLAAERLRRAIAAATRDVAAERPNPEVRFELEKEAPKEAYTVALPVELGGKRARRIAVAEAALRTGEAELSHSITELKADVRRAYFARVAAAERRALLEELDALAGRVLDAARARFDAGGAPRLDVLQAQLARDEVRNQAEAARGAEDAARVTLNALLGLPVDRPTTVVTGFDPGPPIDREAVLAQARAASTELAASDRRLDEARAQLALAHALRTPDVAPEVALTRRAEPEFDTGWRTAVGITVPLFTTHAAGVHVQEAALAQLAAERAALEAQVTGEVAAAAAVAAAARLQSLRYRDEILPQGIEVERMADDAYRLGQTGIAAYLQALQTTRDTRLRAIQAAADLENARADLERAVAAPSGSER
jgi:cobalt-zinc-cadmium efflux system outer membrane protein